MTGGTTKQRYRRRAIAALLFIAAAAVIHEIGLHALAEMGVVDQLLSAGGAESLCIVLTALLFVLLRLFVILLGPGLFLANLALLVWPRNNARPTSQR